MSKNVVPSLWPRWGVLLVGFFAAVLVLAACSPSPQPTAAGGVDPTPIPTTAITANPNASPTPVVVPTIIADLPTTPTATPSQPNATPAARPSPTAVTVPSATVTATATPRPIPTVEPTAIVVSPTPRPVQPTATSVPATPTPTPTTPWINPDCYVGPGAADEPVWWCGGRICVVGAPHYGCPPTAPPTTPGLVQIDCTVSDRDIVVQEIITMRAVQKPANVPIQYAFNHGDGTVDRTAQSRAFYRSAGTYAVSLSWAYGGQSGTIGCGTVKVRSAGPTPTPTPTPGPVTVSCSVQRTTVQVGETQWFTASHQPADVAVSYVFDHGDGTLDPGSSSHAYYAAPGTYNVSVKWSHAGGSGQTSCGVVTAVLAFASTDYLGRSRGAAEAIAASKGFVSRVTRIDTESFPGTTDYRTDRVNFEIDNGIVTAASVG